MALDTAEQIIEWLRTAPDEALMTPGELAILFRVDPKTVTRWAAAGRIAAIKTAGGHRRFRAGVVRAALQSS